MDLVYLVFRYIHLLGFALLLGGWATAYLSSRFHMNPAMLWGAALQVATGIILAAPMGDADPNHIKVAVKAVLAVLIAVMVWVPHMKKRETVAKGHFLATGAMLLVTAGVAVFWT